MLQCAQLEWHLQTSSITACPMHPFHATSGQAPLKFFNPLPLMINTMKTITHWIDTSSEQIGRAVSWLSLAIVLLTGTVVLLRYLFNIGWIAMQEISTYLHAILFMLGAAYTLKMDGHVRVDIFYRPLSPRGKAWVNLLGTLFLLLPVCLFLLWMGWAYVAASWSVQEGSREAGGLNLIWLLKSLILLMPLLIILQGIAQIGHALLALLAPPER